MRPVSLVRVAAEAEVLRLRHVAQRLVARLISGIIALAFLLVAAAWAHIAIWFWLRIGFGWSEAPSAAIMTGGDLVIALAFGVMAARSSPGRVEAEALAIRRRAMTNAATSMATTTVVIPVVRTALGMIRRHRRDGR